jgi:hypothetical protein
VEKRKLSGVIYGLFFLAALGVCGCTEVIAFSDTSTPVLSYPMMLNTVSPAGWSAAVSFSSSKAGICYLVAYPAGIDAPANGAALERAYDHPAPIREIGFAMTGANVMFITFLEAGKTYQAHIAVKDSAGVYSNVVSTEPFTPTEPAPDSYAINTPAHGAVNGIRPIVTFSPAGPQPEGTALNATLAFSGTAAQAAKFSAALCSDGQVTLVRSGGAETQDAAAGGSLLPVTYTFTMPAYAVDDLRVTFTCDLVPVLSGAGVDLSGTTVVLRFTSSEAGTAYTLTLPASAETPGAAAIRAEGTATAAARGANTITLAGLEAGQLYKAYIVVEDSGGNLSEAALVSGITPPLRYTLRYEADASGTGDGQITGITRSAGQFPLPSASELGFNGPEGRPTLKGWTTRPNMRGDYYAVGASFNLNADLSLYAVWSGDGTAAGREIAVTCLEEMPSTTGYNLTGPGKHYILARDISTAAGTGKVTKAIGSLSSAFTGVFDGNGHTVEAAIEGIYEYAGLFGVVYGGTVRRLRVIGYVNVESSAAEVNFAGGVVGFAMNDAIIENILVEADVTLTSQGTEQAAVSDNEPVGGGGDEKVCVGGIVGQAATGANIAYCMATGTVSGITGYFIDWLNEPWVMAGGIAGYTAYSAVLQNCVAMNELISGTIDADANPYPAYHVYRILGAVALGSYRQNNYAKSPMPVCKADEGGIIASISSDSHDDINGANAGNTWAFYSTSAYWKDAAWDTTIWEWDSENSRPRLR